MLRRLWVSCCIPVLLAAPLWGQTPPKTTRTKQVVGKIVDTDATKPGDARVEIVRAVPEPRS